MLIGAILKKINGKKEKSETKHKPLSRPWVDEDLKDGSDHHLQEEGKKSVIYLSIFVVSILSADMNKGNAIFWTSPQQ